MSQAFILVTWHINSFTRVTWQSCHICEWVNESCHMYEPAMSRMRMSHVTYVNESQSCHMCEWVKVSCHACGTTCHAWVCVSQSCRICGWLNASLLHIYDMTVTRRITYVTWLSRIDSFMTSWATCVTWHFDSFTRVTWLWHTDSFMTHCATRVTWHEDSFACVTGLWHIVSLAILCHRILYVPCATGFYMWHNICDITVTRRLVWNPVAQYREWENVSLHICDITVTLRLIYICDMTVTHRLTHDIVQHDFICHSCRYVT